MNGKLTIGKVVHGYRTVSTFETSNKNLNSSGNCNEDVNCDIGPDFQDLKNKLKKAVGLMVVGSSGFCTGTLINNTNNDKAPYFLTANHCSGGEASWAFRFNWISTNVVCSAPSNSISNGPDNFYQTTSGARILAKNPESDFELVEITGGLDNEWDIDWSGWDRTGGVPQRAMGIHHPMGDIMKTCREDQPLVKIRETVPGVSNGQPIQVWGVEDWDFGVTERGSSGSALFDEKGRLIGQLAGGAAGCVGTNDNDAPDFYGRFDVSWSFGSTDSSRLSNWLDPSDTGRKVLDILSQELIDGGGVTPPVMEEEILIYNDSPTNLKITNEANRILDYIVFDVFGKEIASGRLVRDDESIDFSNNAAGVYFVYITNTADGTSFTKKVIMNKRF